MKEKTFFLVAGIIFMLVALLHLLRLYMGWSITINNWAVPMWLSWAGLAVAGTLSYVGLRFATRN